MQGIIKWFSEIEGLGIIDCENNPFCFSLKDFRGTVREGQPVTFEATNKKISIHDELMPLAINILSK